MSKTKMTKNTLLKYVVRFDFKRFDNFFFASNFLSSDLGDIPGSGEGSCLFLAFAKPLPMNKSSQLPHQYFQISLKNTLLLQSEVLLLSQLVHRLQLTTRPNLRRS